MTWRPTRPTVESVGRTLSARLSPVVDRVRDLHVRLGMRDYNVYLVTTRWTGGARDDGVEEVASSVPILPVPKVTSMSDLRREGSPIGGVEGGDVTVSEISLTFSENQLRGLGPNGEQTPRDSGFYYELEFPSALQQTVRRRFTLVSAPEVGPFGSTVRLTRAYDDRQASGAVR